MINIKIGIIYYLDDIILHNRVEYVEYIKVCNADEIILKNIPTLIIGWNLAKQKFNNLDILDKKINELYFWTFSFKERKNDYFRDIDKFISITVINIFSYYEYKILSPVFQKELKIIDDYIKFFDNCEINNVYISSLLQLTILCNNIIYRINLKELEFFNYDYKILIIFLKNKYKNFLYDENSETEKKYINYFNKIDPVFIKKHIILFNK